MVEKEIKVGNVPNLRFPGFEGEWESKRLGELLEFKNGINASKEQYGTGYKFINVLDILNNDYLTHEKIVGKVDVNQATVDKYPVNYGDILFQRSSETREEVGTANVYLDKNYTATFGGFVIRGRKIADYNPIFLNKLLKTNSIRNSITSRSGGSTRYNVGQEILSSTIVTLPPLLEQHKIATFLSLLDTRIETQNKIIEDYESLIRGIFKSVGKLRSGNWKRQYLRDILKERKENNIEKHPVFSVSVSKGLVNQIEYLGRSFAAKNTNHYNVAHFGDIVYTKSPTGDFPFGIIKQNFVNSKVAISPLYAVFVPKSRYLGVILHYYFSSPINVSNYLSKLIQKGAKNTISVTNQHFLDNAVFLPTDNKEIEDMSRLFETIKTKIILEQEILEKLSNQKKYLLQKMFI